MAGVEFYKYKKVSIGDAGHYAHYDNSVRGDPRVDHANTHIDVTKTHLNYYIGTSGWEETRRRIEERMEIADAAHPPVRVRADRVGFYGLNIKCPPELEDTPQEAEFFRKSYELACELLPSVEGAFVHRDEKHEYTDRDTGKKVMSRYEMHVVGAAITQDGRLNGKALINPTLCKTINDRMQAMCLREWGISYQTGEGRKGKKKRTVEQVEAMSVVQEIAEKVQNANAALETVQYATQEAQAELAGQQEKIRQQTETLQQQKKLTAKQEKELEQQEAKIGKARAELQDIRNQQRDLSKEIWKLERKKEFLDDKINIKSRTMEGLENDIGETKALMEDLEREKEKLLKKIDKMVKSHDGLRRTLNIARNITENQRDKIEIRRDKEEVRVEKKLKKPLDGIAALMEAEEAVERAAGVFERLKSAAKGSPEALADLEADDDFGLG